MNKTINEDIKDDVKSILGQKVIDLFGLFVKNKSIEFTFSSGTKIVLKCIKAANINFEFEILLDDKNVLCQWDKLLLTLKIGNKNDTNPIGKYTLNKTVIEPYDKSGNAFTLKFKGTNDKNEYGEVNFKNIVSVEQSSLAQGKRKCNEVPTEEKPEEEKPDKKTKKDDIDPKALYDSIINDPALRDAFYKQPTFWNYLTAIFKGEKPRGPGIVSAAEIVSNYKRNKIFDKLGGNFVENKVLNYKLITPSEITFESSEAGGNQIVYNNFGTYKAKVLEIDFDSDDNYTLNDEKNDVLIKINSKNEKVTRDNPFDVTFIKKYKNGDEKEIDGVIDILSIEGSGYYKKEEKKQTTK